MAAMHEEPVERTGNQSPDHAHVVATFRPQGEDDARPRMAEDHQRDIRHLGRDAARRAVLGAAVVGITVAVAVFLVVWLVADPPVTVTLISAVAAGVFAAAVGALWGSFSRLGRADDWREAVTEHDPPAHVVDDVTGRDTEAPAEAERLEAHGAAEIHVVDEDPADPARTPRDRRST